MVPQTNQIKREGEEKIQRAKEKATSQYLRRIDQFMQTEMPRPERRHIQRFKTLKLPITSRIFSKYSDDSELSHPNKNILLYFSGNETVEPLYL
jgi:hypothetical protein